MVNLGDRVNRTNSRDMRNGLGKGSGVGRGKLNKKKKKEFSYNRSNEDEQRRKDSQHRRAGLGEIWGYLYLLQNVVRENWGTRFWTKGLAEDKRSQGMEGK